MLGGSYILETTIINSLACTSTHAHGCLLQRELPMGLHQTHLAQSKLPLISQKVRCWNAWQGSRGRRRKRVWACSRRRWLVTPWTLKASKTIKQLSFIPNILQKNTTKMLKMVGSLIYYIPQYIGFLTRGRCWQNGCFYISAARILKTSSSPNLYMQRGTSKNWESN